MCIKIVLLLIVEQRGEHTPVLHVVAVDDLIAGLSVCVTVQEERPTVSLRAVNQVGQVKIVVLSLHHGVVDGRVRAVKPARHVLVDLVQTVEIHIGQFRFGAQLYGFHGCGLIHLGSVPVLLLSGEQGAEAEHPCHHQRCQSADEQEPPLIHGVCGGWPLHRPALCR